MTSDTRIKICGIKTPQALSAAVEAGAGYIGFVFFPKSPRNVDLETARELALLVPVGVAKVALVVNPDDAMLDALIAAVPLDMIQLHGKESPDRVAAIKARTGLPVMKAIGVSEAADLAAIATYGKVADQLLVEAKPPKDATRPGGNGVTLDWDLLTHQRWPVPWMLAGGLTRDNVAEAIRVSGAQQIDLSSGVESAPGVKDAGLIAAFCAAVKAA